MLVLVCDGVYAFDYEFYFTPKHSKYFNINVNMENYSILFFVSVKTWEGESLPLGPLQRVDAGLYLCFVNNTVPACKTICFSCSHFSAKF